MHDLQMLPEDESSAGAPRDKDFRHCLPRVQGDGSPGVQNYTRTQYGQQGAAALSGECGADADRIRVLSR